MQEEKTNIMKVLGGRYRYLSNNMLGEGTFGTVYKGQIIQTKQSCAIKVIPKKKISRDLPLMQAIWNQMNIEIQQRNDNIIRRISSQESANNYYLIFQLCESDLQRQMKDNAGMSQARAIDILSQIVNGFSVLVPQGIMHRDLKPANILVSKGYYKISDFGSSLFKVNNGHTQQASLNTVLYSPPQILRGDSYSNKIDIWSCGFIFYQLLHGKCPWYGETRRRHLEAIQDNPLRIRSDLSKQTIIFLQKTLEKTQEDRLSWQQVFFHPIFNRRFNFLKQKQKNFQFNHKNFMKQLAQQISKRSIDIKVLLQSLGLEDSMNFEDFKTFILSISKDIPTQEILYIFNRLDQDKSQTIEISQIQEELDRNSQIVFRPKVRRFS